MIKYSFEYDDKTRIDYELDEKAYFPKTSQTADEDWLEIAPFRCSVCTIDPADEKYCPAALAIRPALKAFSTRVSHEPVKVHVDWIDVQLEATMSTQQAVRSLVGLMLALSRCPIMEKLRPMAQFHLPFGGTEHTKFRALGMYLIAQYMRKSKDLEPDWELDGLLDLYKKIHQVNRKLAERIRAASEKDATVNGLIILDALGQNIEMGISRNLKSLKPMFEMYLRE